MSWARERLIYMKQQWCGSIGTRARAYKVPFQRGYTVFAMWKGPNHDVNHGTRVTTAFNLKDKAEKQSVIDRKQCIPIENEAMRQLHWYLFWSSLLLLIDTFGWTLSHGGYCIYLYNPRIRPLTISYRNCTLEWLTKMMAQVGANYVRPICAIIFAVILPFLQSLKGAPCWRRFSQSRGPEK